MSSPEVIQLNVAQLAVSRSSAVISTILGSCVSVCLYEENEKIGGMIHFALPSVSYAHREGASEKGTPDPLRFGDQAIPILVEELSKLLKSGNVKPAFKAKIVGGACVVDEMKQAARIGELNVEIAEKTLSRLKIPVVGRDVGGTKGRQVIFYTDSGRLRTSTLGENKQRRILIVEDSKTVQKLLKEIFSQDPELNVVGAVSNPLEAEEVIPTLRPDVLTLDIHMPKMNGVEFLEKWLPTHPMPVVMITSVSKEESDAVFRALELGAVDYIQKPSLQEIRQIGPLICEKIKTAAASRVKIRRAKYSPRLNLGRAGQRPNRDIIAIGASTGGTEALREVLIRLPKEIPPIVIVQHIPPVFSNAFANRLNDLCPFEVKEAETGDLIRKERVLIAPGGKQMIVEPCPQGYRVKITDDPPVNRHKPSVDVLFHSVAKVFGKRAIGVILTGMGTDGAKGLLEMKNLGARTISQDENSCVVYGMPKAAVDMRAVEQVEPLEKIPEVLLQWLFSRR